MGKALPLPTQIVIGAGEFLTGYWWLILAAGRRRGVSCSAGARPTRSIRCRFDAWVLRLPLVRRAGAEVRDDALRAHLR